MLSSSLPWERRHGQQGAEVRDSSSWHPLQVKQALGAEIRKVRFSKMLDFKIFSENYAGSLNNNVNEENNLRCFSSL